MVYKWFTGIGQDRKTLTLKALLSVNVAVQHTVPQWVQKWQSLLSTFSWPRAVETEPLTWKRYIDDVSLWNINKEGINAFKELANNYHPTMECTAEIFRYKN